MPSIEIVCIGQTAVSHFESLPFIVEAETRLVSHRKPHPLFQAEFDALTGCIYHLLNPTESWDAYLLLDTSLECMERAPEPDEDSIIWSLSFRAEYAPAVHSLLETLLEASPVGQVLFTSDYQFGPERRRYTEPLTLEQFWALHEEDRLHMNALYPLYVAKELP